MESASGSDTKKTIASAITTPTTVSTTTTSAVSVASAPADNTNHKGSPLLLARGSSNSGSAVTPPNSIQKQQQQILPLDTKQEEASNLSLANIMAEGTRSRCGAPSTSSSPTLSPPGKIFGRNANGTMIATSRPSNEAEIQLYRVLQRASLLAYYDTLLEMGGDDVQQLYEAGEEEFLEIMALVGMASKPLHVRRLQKVLHEWANNPNFFQGPMVSGSTGVCEITPTKAIYFPETAAPTHSKLPSIANVFNPTPLISTTHTNSTHPLPQLTTSTALAPVAGLQSALSYPSLSLASPAPSQSQPKQQQPSGVTHHVTSSSPQLTPVLTEIQVARVTMGAEKIARQLPQREPRAQTSKKRTSRELEQVIAMSEHDPRRMDEIRKYSAIYGRFDCKRRPEKPLTLHEVCVNEAAAQLCRLVPALLTRRDELFPLARQIVKDAGFGHSASIARYGGLVPHTQVNQTQRSSVSVVDCESSDTSSMTPKRPRLSSTDTAITQESTRENLDDSRFNLFAMYQKFSKPPFDLSDIAKFPLGKSHYEDNDDSRFSFNSSSSPSLPQNTSSDPEREFAESPVTYVVDSAPKSCSPYHSLQARASTLPECQSTSIHLKHGSPVVESTDTLALTSSSLGVEVLSAAGSHIIAVTNPALALSPTLNDNLTIKREIGSPDV